MIQGKPLFWPYEKDLKTGEDVYSAHAHILEIISVLGPPPANIIARGNRSSWFFDDDGECI